MFHHQFPMKSMPQNGKVQLTAACAYGGANRRDQEWVGKPSLTATDGEGGHINGIYIRGFPKIGVPLDHLFS